MGSSTSSQSVSSEIDAIIKKFDDWRGRKLAKIRQLIKEADPEVVEEVKWKAPSNPDGVPAWYHDGIICTGETYKKHLRIAFAKGPALNDPEGTINSYRAVLIHEEDEINESAFKDLVRQAVKLNQDKKKSKK